MKALLALMMAVSPVAAAPPGSGFASLGITAVAQGQTFLPVSASQAAVELDAAFASSSIHLGAGQGISSIAWPGALGSTLGTTLIITGGAPPEAEALNDPVVAIAHSGSGPATVSNTTVPGATMTSHATETDVSALATFDGLSTVTGSTGATQSSSSARATGPATAVATARDVVTDVVVAGVLHVGSVTSTGRATTDGVTATASGSTVVSGVSIAGVAVEVDEHGISVGGTSVPTSALSTVQQALAAAQLTVVLSQPTTVRHGGSVEYSSGGLVIGTPFGVLTLGGVQIRAAATRADALPTAAPQPTTTVPGAPPAPPGSVLPGSAAIAPVSPPSAGPVPTFVQSVRQALAALLPTTGYTWLWVPLLLLLSVLASAGLCGLPGRTLPLPDDHCPLERPS